MNNISLLVAIKNNIKYTKNFYETTRAIYSDIEICFVSYDSVDETNSWLEYIKNNDQNVQIFCANDSSKCFSDAYNKAAQLASKEYIVLIHNDIVMYPSFIENILKHLNTNTVVSYTTIEPPIFGCHDRPGKLIYDCGDNLDSFDLIKFYTYSKSIIKKYQDQTEKNIVFFMAMPRLLFLDIGGLDNLFSPFFCEDDDLIKRLKMVDGIKYFTALDALCYHFVSKTSRFSEEYCKITKKIENNSKKNYIRKWGSLEQNFTYKVTLIINNCNQNILYLLEPYAQHIYLSNQINTDTIIENYINSEQLNTKIVLKNKIHNFSDSKPNLTGCVCTIDATNIADKDIYIIYNIQSIINTINKIGSYIIDNVDLEIYDLNTIHQNKIKI